MRVEPASHQALAEIEALLLRLKLPIAGLPDQFPGGYAVATDGGRVVGCAGLEVHGGVGLLRSVVVDPLRQRRGIGRALVEGRIAAARNLRLEAVYLLTTTASDYFVRCGFAPGDRARAPAPLSASTEFASACPASATCLSLRL
jgi:amino-acid N-acetyltransferase